VKVSITIPSGGLTTTARRYLLAVIARGSLTTVLRWESGAPVRRRVHEDLVAACAALGVDVPERAAKRGARDHG
jgi:hypothetical protein